MEKHLDYVKNTVLSYKDFNWLHPIFKEIKGFYKKENELIEYLTEEKTVQRFSENDRRFHPDVTTINSLNTKLDKIDEATIHTGASADEFARSFHALAVTIGKDIYFRNGQYRPETEDGRSVLAHELTHVSQFSNSPLVDKASKEELETEAEVNESKEKYNSDPVITKNINGKQISLRKSLWEKVRKLVFENIEKEILMSDSQISESEYLDLLNKYNLWLERGAIEWLK